MLLNVDRMGSKLDSATAENLERTAHKDIIARTWIGYSIESRNYFSNVYTPRRVGIKYVIGISGRFMNAN